MKRFAQWESLATALAMAASTPALATLNLDWAIGRHCGSNGEWEAGIVGNLCQQISGDRSTGAKLGPFEAATGSERP